MDDPESHAHHSETTVTEFFAPGLYRFKYHQTLFSRLFFLSNTQESCVSLNIKI